MRERKRLEEAAAPGVVVVAVVVGEEPSPSLGDVGLESAPSSRRSHPDRDFGPDPTYPGPDPRGRRGGPSRRTRIRRPSAGRWPEMPALDPSRCLWWSQKKKHPSMIRTGLGGHNETPTCIAYMSQHAFNV